MSTIDNRLIISSNQYPLQTNGTNGANSVNERRRATFANSNLQIQNVAQLSVIKSQVSGVVSENANTAVFNSSQSAKNVQKRLTENLKTTSENFLDQGNLQEKISSKFKTQIESLKKGVNLLKNKFEEKDLSNEQKAKVGHAIAEIADIISRFNNDGVGGINKMWKNSFQFPKKILDADKNDYEGAKDSLKGSDLKAQQEAVETIKILEQKSCSNEGLVKSNLKVLDNNLKCLDEFLKSPVLDRSGVEVMLNFLQQCALNAWVFNDIAEELEKAGITKENLGKIGILSPENKEMLILNQAARGTTMFQEVKVNKLLGEDGARLLESDKNLDSKKAGQVESFLIKWGDTKIGLRGRHGTDKELRVSAQPIGNTGVKENTKQDGLAFVKYGNIPHIKGALRGSFVPLETANLKTVPSEMLKDLEGILDTDTGKKIVELLQNEKLIEAEEDNSGAFPKLKAKPSFASFINDAGLPTYCSVSGTTGEIVSVLHCTLKGRGSRSLLSQVFDNLLKIAEGKETDPLNFNFSTYFAPVATFMEVGHFHTTGEVLGGFYSVAVAERKVNGNEKIDADESGFRKLLAYFNNHQRDFLGSSLSRETLSRIASSSKTSQI